MGKNALHVATVPANKLRNQRLGYHEPSTRTQAHKVAH